MKIGKEMVYVTTIHYGCTMKDNKKNKAWPPLPTITLQMIVTCNENFEHW
jgi:hypothetical protein